MLTDAELHAQGYRLAKRFANGTIGGVQPCLFGAGKICWPLDAFGHSHEWMYEKQADAVRALEAWDGEREPKGWRWHVGPTFELKEIQGFPSIRCLLCGVISFHAKDISERYCGRCHLFHEEASV